MTTLWERVLKLDAVHNFRDYGGWRAADGARVATGRLFRSAHHAHATEGDVERIGRLGILTVTDLRHPEEQREEPSAWIGKLAFGVIEEPEEDQGVKGEAPHIAAFRNSDFSPQSMRAFMITHYGEMPYDPRHVAMFRRYFDALASQDGGILIHCAAGKDRTGILAALTHHVLGVHSDDALEDYLLSNEAGNIAKRLPRLRRNMEKRYNRVIAEEAMHALLTVEEAYIARCWAALGEKSGSVDAYLTDMLGVDEGKRRLIREKLLS
ncbi:tyrosine-protein phosphatase [Sphingobium baderi]|uniref:Tyrosine specific protein phosphatases domain-containing protein n=1 Tax=Sphingobium baderi LL03 TaxID=1114964 RepID=T0GCR5_9SPHN|nr:tyrosine-protein phosphatase [Sphingobium baderi]EQA98476.1 hypothetical protein L485_17490 [Sphingobium baderi LL03]KMS61706.1 hypothetical protein V475_12955 [Sphingobium baderi LL03]